jgi:CheY-like chemotaxis protein
MTEAVRGGSRHDQQPAVDTRFLIVDEDRQTGRALSFMLEARGYAEVRAVRSAARAEAIFGIYQPGVVFLELELANGDSLKLANQLRRHTRHPRLRLIALTGDVEHGMREDARAAGFERFLVKPIVQEELDKILRIPANAG